MSCKYHEEDDLGAGICTADGKTCHYEDGDECPAFEASEHAVLNGFFDDDPDGLEMWQKRRQGISCRTCAHHGDQGPFGRCANCWTYDLHEKKEETT